MNANGTTERRRNFRSETGSIFPCPIFYDRTFHKRFSDRPPKLFRLNERKFFYTIDTFIFRIIS